MTDGICLGVPAQKPPLPHHEILYHLRSIQEAAYHHIIWSRSSEQQWKHTYDRGPSPLGKLPATMSLEEAAYHRNRVAPFYILRNEDPSAQGPVELLINDLLNYIFDKWFRPYRSEIEYGRFLAKILVPFPMRPPEETRPEHTVGLTRGLNASICAGVDKTQNAAKALEGYACKTKLYGLAGQLGYGRSRAQIIRDQHNFILQPLFRAIAVAIRVQHYDVEVDIGRMPVVLVRTGVEDDLSAPINVGSIASHLRLVVISGADGVFYVVETDLETAVGFLMELEQRKSAVFGLRPDPVESTRNPQSCCLESRRYLLWKAEKLGWRKDMQPLKEPSSSWVDTLKHPEYFTPLHEHGLSI